MNGSKRNMVQKGTPSRNGGKTKESAASSRFEPLNLDLESFISNLPIIATSENAKELPKYTSILTRTREEGINMSDLDQLQLDLENLISTVAVRQRYISAETASDEKNSLKRKRGEDRAKAKVFRAGGRLYKKSYPISMSTFSASGIPGRPELPRINLPKNETSEKFWASVEPYCAPIIPAHATFLEKLIEECSQDVDVKVPESGEYYANEWNDTATTMEQNLSMANKSNGLELKKNGLNAMVELIPNPLTQRLLASLIEERVLTSYPSVTGKPKNLDFGLIKTAGGVRSTLCMEKRLRKDLVEQGILTLDDLPKTLPDDEIMEEITKCQLELATVNEYNVQELKRLQTIVGKGLKRQEIKGRLDKIDAQILDVYNRVIITKQKAIEESKDKELDKLAFNRILKEYEEQTDALLKQQTELQKELNDLE